MLIPYAVDVPMERIPMANWLLIGVTVIVSLVVLFGDFEREIHLDPNLSEEEQIEQLLEAMAESGPPLALARDRPAIGLVSHVLVHGDLLHLIGNMLFLFVFGNAINAKLGHVQFLALYFILGAVAGAAWLLIGQGEHLVGASGAIMGLVGVFLVFYPRNDVTLFYWFGAFGMGTAELSSFWFILFTLAMDLLGTIFDASGGIAYIAHLAGTADGAGIAMALILTGLVRSTKYEQNMLEALGWIKQAPRKRQRKRR